MIKKPAIIITSLGRTGTKFFCTLFKEVISDCTALHEPDVFNIVEYRGTTERAKQILKQIREIGVYNLIIRRSLRKWSLIELSDARMRGKLSYAEATQRVLRQRMDFVQSRSGTVYIEANVGYYGLIDILINVYEHHRVAYVVRDGRDWVRSHMNWGEMYGKGRIRSLFAHTWPAASEIDSDPYTLSWDSMSRFEKLCWAWVKLNKYALGTIQENPNARLFRYEDIFRSENRYKNLEELVHFVTTFPNAGTTPVGTFEGWLDRQIHRSEARFPSWEGWSAEHKRQFRAICTSFMKKLGYEID